MNQGRIWCVVNPTVGLPLFLGSIAITSLIVHAEVLSHSNWYGSFYNGSKSKVAMNEAQPQGLASLKTDSGLTITVSPAPVTAGATAAAYVITVTPAQGTAVRSADDAPAPAKLALAAPLSN